MVSIREKAARLLTEMGFSDVESDPAFNLIVQAVSETILNRTNQNEFPEGLTMAGAYRICGQYMKFKKDSGQLAEESGFDFDGTIKQIQEGDTNITFAVGSGDLTPEQRFENLINWLILYGEEQLQKYRKLVW